MTIPLRWWAGALLMAAAGPGLAAEPAASAPRIASKEEYLSCMQAQDVIESQRALLLAQDQKLQVQDAKFRKAEANLAAQVKQHAPASDFELRSYNRAVAARNASAKAFNRESQSLREAQTRLNAQVTDTNLRCGALRFSPADVQAADEERQGETRAKP